MSILPSIQGMPNRFNDPLYSQLAKTVEQALGLPTGILDAVRVRGERSNADQVSSAGARGPYQFIPPTRRGFIKQYGLDPWHDAGQATEAAGRHLLDDYKRTGSWNEAIARYNGGQRPPRSSYANYAAQVGDFDGGKEVPLGQSRYPMDPYYGDPLAALPPNAPEPVKDVIPLPSDPGPSAPVAAGAPAVAHKRGGILGALESVFMPDPGSRWAAALRGGLFDAKANQQDYLQHQQMNDINTQAAQAKLKALLTKGEYQIVGNNVFHIPADGGKPEILTPPTTPSETERLIEHWKSATGPEKRIIESILLKTNSPDALASRERIAQSRAGATVQSARIRSSGKPELPEQAESGSCRRR
jgi:hypothetical protein